MLVGLACLCEFTNGNVACWLMHSVSVGSRVVYMSGLMDRAMDGWMDFEEVASQPAGCCDSDAWRLVY